MLFKRLRSAGKDSEQGQVTSLQGPCPVSTCCPSAPGHCFWQAAGVWEGGWVPEDSHQGTNTHSATVKRGRMLSVPVAQCWKGNPAPVSATTAVGLARPLTRGYLFCVLWYVLRDSPVQPSRNGRMSQWLTQQTASFPSLGMAVFWFALTHRREKH